jgi:hypothetical protein
MNVGYLFKKPINFLALGDFSGRAIKKKNTSVEFINRRISDNLF